MTTLNFKGKSVIRTYHLTVPFRQLTPDPKKSLTKSPSLRDNLIVHGDNLLALKSLLPSFSGKVKCIYIDPPYNTGNEKWVYNDNVNSPMHQEWLKKVVDREDLTRHEKWLCMMWPRLVLLRELLAEDGAIFISIDDNEVHHLRAIMDEIFGEENFVVQIVWQSRQSIQNDTDISENHEYLICYAKNRRQTDRRLKESNIKKWYSMAGFVAYPMPLDKNKFSNPDNDPRGIWKADPFDAPNIRENLTYKIVNPNTGEVYLPPEGRCWRTEEKNYKELLADNRILFGKSGDSRPQLKVFYEEKKFFGEVENTWFDGDTHGTATHATKELQDIFQKQIVFDTPKPTQVLLSVLRLSTQKDSIILDSFAGSGTTAHAVLKLNAEDNGNRKFILVEQEEYADKVTAERVRRVIKGVKKSKNENLRNGFGGTFTYYTLGDMLVEENLLKGKKMPAYKDLARYVFFTATGEQLDDAQVDEKHFYLGESRNYQVYLLYKPDMEFLKHRPLDLDFVKSLGKPKNKTRLVIASHKYVDDFVLHDTRVEFCQLPFAIYRFRI